MSPPSSVMAGWGDRRRSFSSGQGVPTNGDQLMRASGRSGRRVWLLGLRTIIIAVAGNLALRLAALALFDIPAEFAPLAVPGPTIFLTVVGVGAGLAVSHLVDRLSSQPISLFRKIVITALILSLVPDVWLLTDGAAEAFPGATLPAVVTLMVQHVLAAFVVVWMLTMRTPPS